MPRPAKRVKRQLDKPPQPPLPLIAASIIALYLDPYELLMAAQVSRSWYDGFTSDAAWAMQDVYGIEKNVYQHYLKSKDMCEGEEWTCDRSKIKKNTPNLYHVLALIRQGRLFHHTHLLGTPKSFFMAISRSLTAGVFMSFASVPHVYHQDKDLVYALLRVGFSPEKLSQRYSHDRTAALYSRTHDSFEFGTSSPYSVDLLNDFEVALHAVRINWTVYSRLPEDKKADKQLFEAYLTDRREWVDDLEDDPFKTAPENIRSDRELILKWLPCYPYSLASISQELKDDWRVVWNTLNISVEPEQDFTPPSISPAILSNKTYVMELLTLDWIIPLNALPPKLRKSRKVLQMYLNKMAGGARGFEWLNRGYVRRLYAVYPLDLAVDYVYIQRVMELDDPEVDRCDTVREVKAKLEELLGPVPSHSLSLQSDSSSYDEGSSEEANGEGTSSEDESI